MTSTGDVRAQLTGPGGPFEVVTEVVNGVEMKVYKDRMPSLREVPKAAIHRGDQDFLVYGDKRWTYAEFVRQANGVAHALARDAGVGHGDRVAVLSANNPEWCLAFWATVDLGAILVGLNGWWKTDEILYGLDDSGSKVLVADAKRFERIADQLDQAPGLEHIYLIDGDPADYDDPRIHPFADLMGEPSDEFPDTDDRRGRPGGHLLHVGHDRSPEGRHLDAPQHGRQPPEHPVQLHRHRCMANPADLDRWTAGGQTVGAAHLAPLPRLGLPQQPGGRDDRRREAGHPRGSLRPRPRPAAHPGRGRDHLGHRPHHGLAGL